MSYLSDKSTLYLFSSTYRLEVKNKKIYVYKEKEKLDEIPFFSITSIVANHNCIIDQKIFKHATENKISLVFIDGNFNFLASIKHPESKNIFLRKKQYENFANKELTLFFSKKIIEGKIINSSKLLRISKDNLQLWLNAINNSRNIDELRGIEGSFSNNYFISFSKLIRNKDFEWTGRFKHPARGEINALLSWGYTLLGIEIQTFCEIIGLDPYLGFMHTDYYGRPSLVCDLMEEYRSWVVDKFVLNLINLKQININHFHNVNGMTKLTNEGYRIFQSNWLKWVKGDKKYQHIYNTKISIRGVIELQTRLFAKSIMQEYDFKPFIK